MKNLKYKSTYKFILKNSRELAVTGVVLTGALTYTLLFTDNIICRGCVYKEGSIKIKLSELDTSLKAQQNFYKYSDQVVNQETLKKDVLHQLVEEQKIMQKAKSAKIKVSDDEINELYKLRVQQIGSEEKLLAKIKEMYGYNKAQYLEVLRKDLIRDKLQTKK